MANIVSCNVTSFLTRKETGKFKIASKQRCADINDMVENFIISLNDFIMSKTNFEEDGRRRALMSNIKANPDDNILKSLTTMATQNNTALVIEQLAFVINKLTMPRRKQKQDPCCIVS